MVDGDGASGWLSAPLLSTPATVLLLQPNVGEHSHLVEDECLWNGAPLGLTWGGEEVQDNDQDKAQHDSGGGIDAVDEEHHH